MHRLDPIETTRTVVNRYIDYLTTTFSFNDPELREQLRSELINKKKFVKGPILEATPPFETGKKLIELIEEGILSREFLKLSSNALPLDRHLYIHQEEAIRKIVVDKRNVIISTGTGSGKTESFLIPILSYLMRQKEIGRLTPGVRALILYPMNALANDQLKRLRQVLKNYPDITFGSYTGETESTESRAIEKFQKMNPNENRLVNELLSREMMQKKPPHILITNYAMLEYLLLRPDDNVFFDGKHASEWKFIVVDEIHIYSGSKGIEFSMLLRRLKDRVTKGQKEKIQCIGTSATLASENNEEFEEVAKFAEQLFDEKFEWIKTDPKRQDIITGKKKKLNISSQPWGEPEESLYAAWSEIIENESNQNLVIEKLIIEGKKHGIPEYVIENVRNNCEDNWQKFLYLVLKDDKRIVQLQNIIEEKPEYFEDMARRIFTSDNDEFNYKNLSALVHVASNAKLDENSQPLLPVRYHLFIRALEGGFISLFPKIKLYLNRREWTDDKEFRCFEIATCSKCNSLYIVGELNTRDNLLYLNQPGKRFFEDMKSLKFFLVPTTSLAPDNEDEMILLDNNEQQEDLDNEYILCGKCGAIRQANESGEFCSCGTQYHVKVIKASTREGIIHKCPACGSINPSSSIVRRLILGSEAATSVLATALYQHTGERENPKLELNSDDGWYVPSVPNSAETKKRMLIFSDSRQDAAFFSVYLENSYNLILQKRLLAMTIERFADEIIKNEWRINDLARYLKRIMQESGIFKEYSPQELEEIAWKYVLNEFLERGGETSLTSLGVLSFKPLLSNNQLPPALRKQFVELTENEANDLLFVLLDTIRKYGAVKFPDIVDRNDEFFAPLNKDICFKYVKGNEERTKKSAKLDSL